MPLHGGRPRNPRDNAGMDSAIDSPRRPALSPPLREAFAALGPAFYTDVAPWTLPDPYWVVRSRALGRELGLDDAWLESDEALQALSGNALLTGSTPRAGVYSGHQFGLWAGQLGDGRALSLGELDAPGGPQELQIKGAGRTPYSRRGDGRAVLRSSIREFLCSEAMHGLGIPTTRALCVTGADVPIRREEMETAAVLTRTAPSFLRFGHFEHFSHHGQPAELRRLADHVIDRFYPACRDTDRFSGNPYAALLEAVSERTAALLAQWQAVGFCHGVMNTDNMSILGLTLDYGPFQFMDAFSFGHICNHTDVQGRYAFGKQPNVAYWNLFCLGQALLPLIDDSDLALAALESYKTVYPREYEGRMRAKLGLPDAQPDDRVLIESILKLMAQDGVDFTLFWRRLSQWAATRVPAPTALPGEDPAAAPVRDLFLDRAAADRWMLQYSERTIAIPRGLMANLMLKTNPKYVLRNHLAEIAIRQAKLKDFTEVENLLTVLQNPFDEHPAHEDWAGLPPEWAAGIEISCSS